MLKESNDRRSEEVAPETKSRSRPTFLSRKNSAYVHFPLFLVKLRAPRPPVCFSAARSLGRYRDLEISANRALRMAGRF